MNLLFVHQNFPGQFKHLARFFGADPGHRVKFLTQRQEVQIPGVEKVLYRNHRPPDSGIHPYLMPLEQAVLYGQGATRELLGLKDRGFVPDIVIAHPGWGESLFVKDIFPDTPLLNFFEFFYRALGADVDFDPEYQGQPSVDEKCGIRMRNALHLLSLEAADWGISPTRWQWQVHPAAYRPKISVIHDGVDTNELQPDPGARLEFASGTRLTAADEVVTYVSRNLEPYRGFHIFMRAAAIVAKRRPKAHFIIVGGDDVSYGKKPANGRTYRENLLSEVDLDIERVHFLGRVPYAQFKAVLQLSSAHIYLTYPFVLSWSMLEAMSSGCLVIGSATPPVQEAIEDGRNGLLVDFFSPDRIADRVDEVFASPDRLAAIRRAARQTILERYDLKTVCLPRQIQLIEKLAAGKTG